MILGAMDRECFLELIAPELKKIEDTLQVKIMTTK